MQKLGIFLTLLMILNIIACDGKTENYYKNHPNEAKQKAKECKESATLSQDCINALKISTSLKNKEEKYNLNIQPLLNDKISDKQNSKKENKILQKDFNQNLEKNEDIIVSPIQTPFEIYPFNIKEKNQNFKEYTVKEKLP